ncbi:GNAT family N-acetyltransferase [Natranaerofaba carboxydovora]|uniref:GNAT family N-acetyltransferase n=1 Tax=Natranaerofaba carboxydovora TaxID=2742683 RepID=UPI001F141CB3|nr:GNAT family protein [Natranaerofaba carboxydovora]UMZ74511.1 Spermidine N(1)-acetyltransferase [Natranaerofaba carboxydovora]
MAISYQFLNKIYLRPPKACDVKHYVSWWNESFSNYLDLGSVTGTPSKSAVSEFTRQVQDGYVPGWFTIMLWDEYIGDIRVGYIRYRNIDWKKKRVEIAIRLGRKYWGKGIGKSAIGELLAHLFYEKGLEEAWLSVASFNQRAIRLYEKCGFTELNRKMDPTKPELTWIIMGIHRSKFAKLVI